MFKILTAPKNPKYLYIPSLISHEIHLQILTDPFEVVQKDLQDHRASPEDMNRVRSSL